jgi:hypothetical protein
MAFSLFALLPENGKAQHFSFASKAVRDSITKELVQKINTAVVKPVNEQTLNEWKGACWAMELMLYKPRGFKKRIPAIISNLRPQPVAFQQSFLEMVITLYPGKFKKQVSSVWTRLGSNKVKAMALEQLALAKRFPDAKADAGFSGSEYYTSYSGRWLSGKPIFPGKDVFLQKDFLNGQTMLVSFQYRNRDKPGCLMIRTAGHEWLKDEKGVPYCFTQLARSITNMPWYITNGNTPQGLHKIIGTDVSGNNWIGPTINLQIVMPLEEAPQIFFSDTAQSYNQYKALLGPASVYAGLYESYFAGKIGRSKIIAHGTTIPEWYYKGKTYYPCTPSLGCLCSPEMWDEYGMLQKSTQQQWMNIVQQLAPKPVYLLVAEIGE